jgi:phage FluMu protein Com
MDLRLSQSESSAMERTPKAIRCLQCGSLMTLVLAPGDKGPRSLRCLQCERLDPLTASEVAGWLKGELQPPK